MGCGSTEILRVAVLAFCRADRPLVSAAPTFEEPVRMATALKVPVTEVAVDKAMRLDLGAMADTAGRPPAGLVFCCNPNNPTATAHGAAAIRDFLVRTHAASAETTVLVDEAYHDFVEDPSYATAIPLVKEDPRLVVSRTFSKVYGLAGFRVGYAIARPETIATMRPWRCGNSINLGAAVGAVAAMGAPAHIKAELREEPRGACVHPEILRRPGLQGGALTNQFRHGGYPARFEGLQGQVSGARRDDRAAIPPVQAAHPDLDREHGRNGPGHADIPGCAGSVMRLRSASRLFCHPHSEQSTR